MSQFAQYHGAAQTWQSACEKCVASIKCSVIQGNLGFVYVTDHLCNHLPEVLVQLREASGIEQWVGSVGLGICAPGAEYFDRPALSVMICDFPTNSFRIFHSLYRGTNELTAQNKTWLETNAAGFAVVHGAPNNPAIPSLVEKLCTISAGRLVGGISSSRVGLLQVAEDLTQGGLSGVLFGPQVPAVTGITQGCTPVGDVHRVTGCDANIVMTLDGRPALEVFDEDIGELMAHDYQRITGYIFAAIPVVGSDENDYVVRNMIGADRQRSLLAIDTPMRLGDPLMFVRRDPKAAQTDLKAMLGKLTAGLEHAPKAGLYFSCLARGANMFGSEGQELAMVKEYVGDIPLTGFFANGEIAHNRVYSYTGVLTLFL